MNRSTLDEKFLITQAPSTALSKCEKELLHLGGYADKAFSLLLRIILFYQNEKTAEKGSQDRRSHQYH